jgi:hypothetical protein
VHPRTFLAVVAVPGINNLNLSIISTPDSSNSMGNRALTITALVLSLPMIAHAKISYANSEAQKPGIVKAAPNAAADVVLVGAGDIASCDDLAGAKATAKLIDEIPGIVFAVGDLAYPNGSDEEFANCYTPTLGRFKDRTRPAPGNHEYHSDGASGYSRYFGAAAGDTGLR